MSTRDEYIAKAMLLGMEYDEPSRCFVMISGSSIYEWLDRDTLEHVPRQERIERRWDSLPKKKGA